MAASGGTVCPSPLKNARAVGAAGPPAGSAQPLLGVFRVGTGAGGVTLTSRLISLGVPDFRGLHGFGYDESAWISGAFDAGLMFIGPFTVYLGGLMGPRRILLTAAALFTVLLIFLPFAHSYSLVIAMAFLGGLTSGTFYPLTLTFSLRNIPFRYLPFHLAFYAPFVDGAVNIAPSLYGWYRNHLSSNWMFWNSALITPLMMICIYYGIPKTKAAKKSGEAPDFAGFLYASAGLAMLLLACEQCERLGWSRSGVSHALFSGGALVRPCAARPWSCGRKPLAPVPYLLKVNTVLLGSLLFCFRFTLFPTLILLPQALAL